MIILITGATHTGKTLLAQKMLEEYSYPYLSIDHLKMGLIRSGNTGLTPEDDEALTEYLWPIVREIVKTAIENRQNLIVEGCYIPFGWRRDFDEQYLSSIRFICLAMSERYIENHYGEIIGYESEIETRLINTDCSMDSLKADNKSIINGFQHVGEQIVLIDSDYKRTIKRLLDRQSGFIEVSIMMELLKARFSEHKELHPDLEWSEVEHRLREFPAAIAVLQKMEESGGEPDTIGYDEQTGKLIFCDCAKESPSGRRSLCYDEKALQGRTKNPPSGSTERIAKEIGVSMMTEELYRRLQSLGYFDLKTSSWIATPDDIRSKGGALFCERRYDTVFTFHNSADSYYSVRGFRGYILV